ncbi:hypothetical protein EIP86_009032 [Pleurotus ostreatoroseus]|nr:hypothetical protein EIP86_009032 [Pleurotus ostreatoroseus]
MGDFGTPPAIPTEFAIYNSYAEDPIWQKKFSTIWAAGLGIAILASLPHLIWSIKTGKAYRGLFGISEDLSGMHYAAMAATLEKEHPGVRKRNKMWALVETCLSVLRWTLPGLEMDFGQMLVVVGYVVAMLICLTKDSELVTNPNRGGFMALAQFPVVFLFATKNSVVSLLLGPGNGFEKLNYVHRWAGRGLFICAAVHGALWIRNHLQYDLPIIGQQKEESGVAAFGVLCFLVLSSFRPVRRYFYQFFFLTHVLGYVAFFITVCYHTQYAAPWIFPPLAFYGLDILMRMLRYSIKDASLVPVDNSMTLIHIHDCDKGWQAGQFVRLRVFFNSRIFESHPLTIVTAPPATSCVSSGTLTLAARVRGDWTRALNEYAAAEQSRLCCEVEKGAGPLVQVMIDGAYGGCSIDIGDYESVLLIAGGAGASFTLGLLDDIVGRVVKLGRSGGEKTKRIEFAWCVKSFGCIEWFSPMLTEIAHAVAGTSLDLHVSVYVTCLCNPEAVPTIPNSEVSVYRPSMRQLLQDLVTPDAEDKLKWTGLGGGVAVCASGPETLCRETQNAVARMGAVRGLELGGIGLHTELFAM